MKVSSPVCGFNSFEHAPSWSAALTHCALHTLLCQQSGEVTPPTSSDTSLPRPSTSPSRTTSSPCSATRRTRMDTVYGSSETWLPVVLLVPHPFSSSTPSTTPVPVSLTTTSPPRRVVNVNSTVSSMSTRRPSPLMVSPVVSIHMLRAIHGASADLSVLPQSTVVSSHPSSVSSSTVVYTSACTTP